VVTLLYGTQHRKDSELWPYVCGRIKEEGQKRRYCTPERGETGKSKNKSPKFQKI